MSSRRMIRTSLTIVMLLGSAAALLADTGDPQIRTNHPWYPGELAVSTFDRLFATQAETYQRVTGLDVESDEQKALASWLWRNTHYWHGEAGRRDLWGDGFRSANDSRLREYWNGLFGYGFGLCGTTHSQWTAEFEHLLGHGRGRGLGAAGHNAFEVFLQRGNYGANGRWALLDHDLSTVIFDESGRRLLGLGEMQSNVDGLDLTDCAKGRSQYWLRFSVSAKQLADSNLQIRTVCQANVAVLPRLKDDGTTISYEASGNSVRSMGPEMELAKSFVTDGAFGEKTVTLTATPSEPVTRIYAAAHTASGSPPNPDVRYSIEYSLDAGKNWQPIVKDWVVPRRGDEPDNFWSQSFCYGSCLLSAERGGPIQIRFRNDGGKHYLRVEAHLIQHTGNPDPVEVTYQWTDSEGEHQKSHVFDSSGQWQLATARNVRTRWVEFEPAP